MDNTNIRKNYVAARAIMKDGIMNHTGLTSEQFEAWAKEPSELQGFNFLSNENPDLIENFEGVISPEMFHFNMFMYVRLFGENMDVMMDGLSRVMELEKSALEYKMFVDTL